MARPPSSLKFVIFSFLAPTLPIKRTGQVADKERVFGFSLPRLSIKAGLITIYNADKLGIIISL
jgi:hypothetical protein